MLNLQLYIEGKEVDLFKDESVTLTQSLQDVKDIEKVFTDFSRTFSVPASRANNKIFGHFYNYHIVGDSAFDARKKITAKLYLNYELFKEGKVKFEGATRKDNKAHTYRITFFGNGVNLKDIMGDDNLKSLPLLKEDAFKFTYNDTNIKQYLKDGLDITVNGTTYPDAILFPLISHSKRLVYDSGSTQGNTDKQNNIAYVNNSSFGLQLSQLKPALRVYPIIKAIEQAYGITFSSDFFSDTNEPFYNLYLWLHNKTGGLFEDEGNESPVGNFVLSQSNSNGAVLDLYDNYFVTPQADQRGAEAREQRILDVTIFPSISDSFSFIIYKDGIVFEEYRNVTPTSGSYAINGLNIDAGRYTFAIDTGTASTYNFNFYVKRKNNTGSGDRKAFFTGSTSVLSNVQLRASNQLPDIKVLDFITSLFKMFNLTSFQNSDGTVEVKTLDSFYSTSTKIWDITKFVDKSESSVDTVLPFKQIDFGYEGLDNFFAKNHLELFDKNWGTEKYTSTDISKIEGETYKVSIPLEHFKYERLKDVNGGLFKDLLWGWSADIKQEPNLGKPLLFYPILSTQDIGVIDSNGDLDRQTDVFIPSNSVRLTDSKNLNFSAEPNEYLGTPFKKTLFSEYYENYIREIFESQRRLTTIKAFLPLSMTLDLSLADKIRIFDNLYKINKITTNFETNKSTLELINIKTTITPIVPDRFLPNSTCIKADTTAYSVDSFIITADSDCNVEGLEIISPNEVIPNDIDSGNNPQIDDHTVPVPVTQALISLSPAGITGQNTVMFYAIVDATGQIGNVSNWAEYGVFWTTNQYALLPTDFSTLDTDSSLNKIVVQSTALDKHSAPKNINFKVTGLSPNTNYYYKSYIKTNADSNYNTGDETIAITELGFRTTLI